MEKVTKRVFARHLGEEFPLKINVTAEPQTEKTKSGKVVSKNILYRFECSLDNIDFIAQSNNDASIAFNALCEKLQGHGYKICCCGTCTNFYLDWATNKNLGGMYGYCLLRQNRKDTLSQNNVRHIIQNCQNQALSRDAEDEFILKE